MKITVTFNSLEELKDYLRIESPSLGSVPRANQKAPAEVEKPTTTAEDHQSTTQDQDLPWNTAPEQETPKVTEDYRVEVRRVLARLNKQVGKNVAKDLIGAFGVNKLTEVALADLPALMDRAKEVLNAE